MKRASALLVAFLVAGGVSAAFFRGSRARAGASDTAGASSEPAAIPTDGDEVQRLRAELQKKDQVIRALVAQGADKDTRAANLAAAAVAAASREADREEALEHARQVLDERLAAPGAGSVAELEHAVAAMLDPGALGTTRVTSRRCNGAMCRVTLAGDTPAALNASIETLMDRQPKTFAGAVVYDAEDGTRALYLARSSDDLAIAPTAN
jgi:hypothetical protein